MHGAHDVKEEMEAIIRKRAAEDLGTTASKLWEEACKAVDEKYSSDSVAILKLPKSSALHIVSNTRRQTSDGNPLGNVDLPQYACISEVDKRLFLKYNFRYEHPDPTPKQRNKTFHLLIWSHPDLLPILRRKGIQIFIDGTFRVVPKGFKQCTIVMAHDDDSNMNLPVVFALMQDKSSWSYWLLLNLVIVSTCTKMEPGYITCDFELGLMLACKEQFPNATIVGCLFHLKQAWRRRMVKIGIPDEEISDAMKKGNLDSLTVIDPIMIEERIRVLRNEMERSNKSKWDEFWTYFRDTWMDKYEINDWNIYNHAQKGIFEAQRTNNCLENFNRQLNSRFVHSHPNTFHFIETIRSISVAKVREWKMKRSGEET